MNDTPEMPEDDALAAEYVLHLLDADERRAFEARLTDDRSLQARVALWEAELVPMAANLPDVAPPPELKARIMRAIAGETPPARPKWLAWLAVPSLAALAAVVFLVVAPMLSAPAFDPAFHASLASEDGALRIEAGYAPDGQLFRVIREAGEAAPGRDFELWVIAESAEAPVSLGVIPRDEADTTFEISPEVALLIDGGILAVSDEPLGGSPTGAPTGDVLATGAFFDV